MLAEVREKRENAKLLVKGGNVLPKRDRGKTANSAETGTRKKGKLANIKGLQGVTGGKEREAEGHRAIFAERAQLKRKNAQIYLKLSGTIKSATAVSRGPVSGRTCGQRRTKRLS